MLKHTLMALVGLFLSAAIVTSCGSSYEEVQIPTQGLITTVVEVSPESYKIEDEQPVPDTSQSLIIAKYLDNTIDTFTLAEARLVQQSNYNGARSGVFTAASYGFFGYMMGRSMSSYRPSASAYSDPNTYNRVNSTTGSTIQNSSTTTRRAKPSSGSKSGYGSGKSSRSYGG
jgi:hypothetical protein